METNTDILKIVFKTLTEYRNELLKASITASDEFHKQYHLAGADALQRAIKRIDTNLLKKDVSW